MLSITDLSGTPSIAPPRLQPPASIQPPIHTRSTAAYVVDRGAYRARPANDPVLRSHMNWLVAEAAKHGVSPRRIADVSYLHGLAVGVLGVTSWYTAAQDYRSNPGQFSTQVRPPELPADFDFAAPLDVHPTRQDAVELGRLLSQHKGLSPQQFLALARTVVRRSTDQQINFWFLRHMDQWERTAYQAQLASAGTTVPSAPAMTPVHNLLAGLTLTTAARTTTVPAGTAAASVQGSPTAPPQPVRTPPQQTSVSHGDSSSRPAKRPLQDRPASEPHPRLRGPVLELEPDWRPAEIHLALDNTVLALPNHQD